MRILMTLMTALLVSGTATPTLADSTRQSAGQASLNQEQQRERLITIKQVEWPGYYREQDSEGLRQFLSEDFVLIENSGAIGNRASEVAWLADNPWSGPEDFHYHVIDVVFHAPDVAMVYGEGRGTVISEDGSRCQMRYKSSNLLRLEADRWRPAFSHVSGYRCDAEE